IEMYAAGRYFTVTGQHVEGTPVDIQERENEIKEIHERVFGSGQKPQTDSRTDNSLSLSDADLIKKATEAANGDRFCQLWKGNFSEYASQSEADLALCSMLAFWTARD